MVERRPATKTAATTTTPTRETENNNNNNNNSDPALLVSLAKKCNFPNKVYKMLEYAHAHHPSSSQHHQHHQDLSEEVCGWDDSGTHFCISDPSRFMKELASMFFPKQSSFRAFERQLNIWGFVRKLPSELKNYTFSQEYFIRHRPDLIKRISRKENKRKFSRSLLTGMSVKLSDLSPEAQQAQRLALQFLKKWPSSSSSGQLHRPACRQNKDNNNDGDGDGDDDEQPANYNNNCYPSVGEMPPPPTMTRPQNNHSPGGHIPTIMGHTNTGVMFGLPTTTAATTTTTTTLRRMPGIPQMMIRPPPPPSPPCPPPRIIQTGVMPEFVLAAATTAPPREAIMETFPRMIHPPSPPPSPMMIVQHGVHANNGQNNHNNNTGSVVMPNAKAAPLEMTATRMIPPPPPSPHCTISMTQQGAPPPPPPQTTTTTTTTIDEYMPQQTALQQQQQTPGQFSCNNTDYNGTIEYENTTTTTTTTSTSRQNHCQKGISLLLSFQQDQLLCSTFRDEPPAALGRVRTDRSNQDWLGKAPRQE